MDLKEVEWRLRDHFEVHNDGRPTPYLDEAVDSMFDALNEYNKLKELEQQNRLLKLPCRIGEKVWSTRWWDDVTESITVNGLKYFRTRHVYKVTETTFGLLDIHDFGVEIFKTKKEARKACKLKNKQEREE